MEGFARRLAIPESLYRLSVGVGLRHPVMSRHVALMAGSIFLAWVDLSQTGHAYSADEKQRAKAVDRRVSGLALHLVPVSLLTMLFLAQTLALVFATWVLKERQRSRVTPRYTVWSQFSRRAPDQETFSWHLASRLQR